jgi:2Fe-2S ferredoxin
MPTLTFIGHDGTAYRVDAEIGQSVMQAATFAGVPGIPADCGGACACATCHAYLDEAWLGTFPPPEGTESDMLENVTARQPNSRLTCQLVLGAGMDGLTLRLPESQL